MICCNNNKHNSTENECVAAMDGICVRCADHYKNFFTDVTADAAAVAAAAAAAVDISYYYTWFDGHVCSIFHWNYFDILFK